MEIKYLEVNAKVPKLEVSKGKKRVYIRDEKGEIVFEDKDVKFSANVDLVRKRGYDKFEKHHKHINGYYKDGQLITDKKSLWTEITGQPVKKAN